MRNLRRAAVLVFLALALVAPSAFAKEGLSTKPQLRQVQQVGLLGNLWSFIARLLPAQGISPTQNTDEGCRLEPLGLCAPTQNTDAGCRMDPLGACLPDH